MFAFRASSHQLAHPGVISLKRTKSEALKLKPSCLHTLKSASAHHVSKSVHGQGFLCKKTR